MKRPNLLIIHADQHRWDCLGAHGHPQLQTPHLDRLAAEGADFVDAYTPIPLCVPARCSLLFGRWSSGHQAIADFHAEPAHPDLREQPCWSRLLADAGYHLGFVGKWAVDPHHDPTAYGFHEYVPLSDYGPWRASLGLPPRPNANEFFGETDPHIVPEQSRLAWGADHALAVIAGAAARGEPFCVRWDPSEPHLPNVPPEPYASMYPPESIEPWPSFPDPLEGKPYIQAQQRRTWGLEGWSWEQWQPIVSRYLGEISLLDAQIGRLLERLDQLGLAENTLVAYTCDHGDLCGGHGMIDKHMVMYDDIVRVPLLLRWPAAGNPGRVPGFVVHALDLAATICDAANVETPDTFAGRSLAPLLRGEETHSGRDDVFSAYHGNQFGLYSQRMVRDARWKYVWNATAEDELYDLAADPGEIVNLAGDATHAETLARLRGRMVAWMEQTGDRLLNAWTRAQLERGLTR